MFSKRAQDNTRWTFAWLYFLSDEQLGDCLGKLVGAIRRVVDWIVWLANRVCLLLVRWFENCVRASCGIVFADLIVKDLMCPTKLGEWLSLGLLLFVYISDISLTCAVGRVFVNSCCGDVLEEVAQLFSM